MHRTAYAGFSGHALWEPLFDSALKLGVSFFPASKAKRIILDANGSAGSTDLKYLDSSSSSFKRHKSLTSWGKKFQLMLPGIADTFLDRADRLWEEGAQMSSLKVSAVILDAGGFAFNPEMRKQYAPDFHKVAPLGTRGDDGSGIRLGQSVGGSVSNMDIMSAWRFLYPPTALLEGVVVAQNGRRFSAEDVYGATLSDRMIRQQGSKAFLILDSVQWAKAKSQLHEQTQSPLLIQRLHWLRWDHTKARSIDSIANEFSLPLISLQETIANYNDAIFNGKEDPMHKEADYCTPILRAPLYIIDISPKLEGIQAVNGLTLGGLRVDGNSRLVLRQDNTCINSLYAAGRNAVGICSNGYVSGLSIADGVFSGKRAAEHAVKQL